MIREVARDPFAWILILVMTAGSLVGYFEYRLSQVETQVTPIVQLDAQQVIEAMSGMDGNRPKARAVAERIKQISEHYADRGHIVLDHHSVLAAPEGTQINVQR